MITEIMDVSMHLSGGKEWIDWFVDEMSALKQKSYLYSVTWAICQNPIEFPVFLLMIKQHWLK